MAQNAITELSAQDMQAVNALILERLQSDVSLINQLGYYIISGGGKRMRPLLTVLSAKAVSYTHLTLPTKRIV